MEAFGFFDKTEITLPGEEVGIHHDIENVGPVELAVMSFGQRFTITPMQMITAASAVANGGYLYRPTLIKQIENTSTGSIDVTTPHLVRRVLSEETSKHMMDIMYTRMWYKC